MDKTPYFSADAILQMLKEAYASGFAGPLEMAEETCRAIMAGNPSSATSDLTLMGEWAELGEKQKTQSHKYRGQA